MQLTGKRSGNSFGTQRPRNILSVVLESRSRGRGFPLAISGIPLSSMDDCTLFHESRTHIGWEQDIRVLKTICGITTLLAVVGALFLGFYACGGYAYVNLLIGSGVLIAVCVAVLSRWFYSGTRESVRVSRLQSFLRLIVFAIALLTSCLIANAIGWVIYYSPTSLETAYREFRNGLVGIRCE